jgi:hypothetical protein
MDNRNRFEIWYDAAERFAIANTLSSVLPIYIVTEYPKSGGTWVCQMIADYLCLPFPRNKRVPLKSAVHHAHYMYSPFLNNVTSVMRDGRDIMVSFYYHMLFENEKSSPIIVRKTRSDLNFKDYDDIKNNLPVFIEYLFDKQYKSKSPFQFTWPQFVRSWIHKSVPIVKYEDFVNNGVDELYTLLHNLTNSEIGKDRVAGIVQKFSFSAQTNRRPGIEQKNSFLRKGVPGDWKEKFNLAAAKLFCELAGTELVMLGYETNHDWVKEVE